MRQDVPRGRLIRKWGVGGSNPSCGTNRPFDPRGFGRSDGPDDATSSMSRIFAIALVFD